MKKKLYNIINNVCLIACLWVLVIGLCTNDFDLMVFPFCWILFNLIFLRIIVCVYCDIKEDNDRKLLIKNKYNNEIADIQKILLKVKNEENSFNEGSLTDDCMFIIFEKLDNIQYYINEVEYK